MKTKAKRFRAALRGKQTQAHATADAAVVYVVLMETAKGALVFGGFITFVFVAVLFMLMDD